MSPLADTSYRPPKLRCRWTQTCQNPAEFHVPQDQDNFPVNPPSPDVCARHLGQSVKTSAVLSHTREVTVWVA